MNVNKQQHTSMKQPFAHTPQPLAILRESPFLGTNTPVNCSYFLSHCCSIQNKTLIISRLPAIAVMENNSNITHTSERVNKDDVRNKHRNMLESWSFTFSELSSFSCSKILDGTGVASGMCLFFSFLPFFLENLHESLGHQSTHRQLTLYYWLLERLPLHRLSGDALKEQAWPTGLYWGRAETRTTSHSKMTWKPSVLFPR